MNPNLQETIEGIKPVSQEWRMKAREYLNQLAIPQEVTPQMVNNFVRGGAAINVLATVAGAQVLVVDMGVAADLEKLVREGKIISYKNNNGTACLWFHRVLV